MPTEPGKNEQSFIFYNPALIFCKIPAKLNHRLAETVTMTPAQENDTLIFCVALNRAGASSMEIGIKVVAENNHTGEKYHRVPADFTVEALDDVGHPMNVLR